MSITKETAMQHKGDPAVTCCRFEAGEVIEPSILEDPAIFPDLQDTGLLDINDETLTIGQVIGGKLKETVDALTPLTMDLVEELPEEEADEAEEAPAEEAEAAEEAPVAQAAPQAVAAPSVGGYATIKIAEGKNIEVTFPVVGGTGVAGGAAFPQMASAAAGADNTGAQAVDAGEEAEGETHEIRTLKKNTTRLTK